MAQDGEEYGDSSLEACAYAIAWLSALLLTVPAFPHITVDDTDELSTIKAPSGISVFDHGWHPKSNRLFMIISNCD